MRLIRNTTNDGLCKYAIIRLDKLRDSLLGFSKLRIQTLFYGVKDYIEFGEPKTEDEFFVIKLKDVHSKAALLAYAQSCESNGDKELAKDVYELADRAGIDHKSCKNPD